MDNICGWEIESGQYMCVGNREWAIYVCGKWRVDNVCVWEIVGIICVWEIESGQCLCVGNRVDNICGWEMESGQYLCVENREWTIYVGGK